MTFQVSLPRALVYVVKITFADVFCTVKNNLLKRPVFIKRHAGVKKQIAVMAGVDAAFFVQIIQMNFKQRAFREVRLKFVDNFLLFICQGITVGRVKLYRREGGIFIKRIFPAADIHAFCIKINLVKQKAAFHFKIGIALNQLSFQFEHNHFNSFFGGFNRLVIGINIRRKNCKRTQAYTVAAL